jgi:Protein of unknown function (DUF3352)
MMKKKKPSLPLTLGAATLLIGGGAAAFWVLVQRQSLSGMPVGVNVIPQDALIVLSLSTEGNQWQQMRAFGTPQSQAAFNRTLTQLRDRFLTPNGYNYQRDIQPWVGKEVTFALLPSQSPPPQANATQSSSTLTPPTTASSQQSVVMILPIDQPLQAKQALEPTNSPLQQGKWLNRSYKGVEIKETKNSNALNPNSMQYSATVLDRRFLIVTTNPKATEQVIDTYQAGASIANTPGYRAALSKIESERAFAKLYLNVPVAAAAARNSQPQLSPQGLAQIQQQGIAATVTLKPEGLLFKSISWLKPNSEKKYLVKNEAGKIPSRLPSDTLMMMSGGNLQRFWQEYVQSAQSNPLTPFKPEEMRDQVKKFTHLDLEQDLLPWMAGEFSLSLMPLPQATPNAGDNQVAANTGPGLVFMVKASDPGAAQKSIAQMNQVMREQNNFKVEETKVGDRSATKWISPTQELTITQGWLEDNVAFLTLGTPVTGALVPQSQTALAQSDRFRNTVPLALNPNNGHFFLDVERLGVDSTARLLTFLFQLSTDPSTQKAIATQLAPIRGIGVTAAVSDERSTRFDIFVSLKKAGTPKPLPRPTPERFSQPSL